MWTDLKIKAKDLFGIRLTTAEKNHRFQSMPPADRRVAIAKDVVAQLRCGRYMATTGVYFAAPGAGEEPELVEERGVKCQVCAVGSLMASGVRLFNRERSLAHAHNVARKYFSREQVALMECAFETDKAFARDTPGLHTGYSQYHSTVQAAVDFGLRFDDPSDRLEAIMENVIANGGEFVL